jgi:release factor glutamine methyltransferase
VTVGEALAHGTAVLAEAGIDTARLEAELLLAKACDDCARALLYMELRRELSPEAEEGYEALLARRARREPLAYILGRWGFRRLTLKTDRRALVPRPETEIVVERALEHLDGMAEPAVLDVGTGTGAIAFAIADEHPRARVTAIDASHDALALARENFDLLDIDGRVRLVEHDLTEGLGHDAFDLVVSNPPYVEPEDIETLQPEVRDWEPRIALVAHGATEEVARAATEALRPGGWVVLEVAENQAASVAGLLHDLGYEQLRVSPDMAGRDRVIEARWSR